MTAQYASKTQINEWDSLVAKSGSASTVFSTAEYAEIKKDTRYTPRYIMVDSHAVLVLEKRTWPLGRLWYIPKGPNVASTDELFSVLEALKPLARATSVFTIRVESELPRSVAPTLEDGGLVPAAAVIPSSSTITLDISPSLDDFMQNLPQKSRYAIRRAERDGVTVRRVKATEENCRIMYELLSGTASGQFGIRRFEYYKKYWQTFEKSSLGQLFFAYYDGTVVAGAYALYFNGKSTYKDGASIRERTAYGASHLLQWHVIQWAKERGSSLHDLCGSPPSDKIHDSSHPHYNIGLFKTSFNKTVTDYIGCYDMIISPARYAVWQKIGERVHKKIYFKTTHDYYY